MTFNQKIVSLITLLCVGITAAVTFTCFEPPYGGKFWMSFLVLIFSQIVFGAFWVQQIAKSDGVLPMSIGVWGLNLSYFLFSLFATLLTGIADKYFVLLHTAGFAIFVIAHLFFRIAEHHIEEMSKDDEPEQKIERAKVTWR